MKHPCRFLCAASLGAAFLAGGPPAAEPQAPAAGGRRTIEVRVFDGPRFVDGLTLADFELQEDGVPCEILGLAAVAGNAVTRHEGPAPAPSVARRFHLLFQMYEYHPKMAEALRYFFAGVILPGDALEVQTPVQTYELTPQALARKPGEVLARETDDLVRKDINKANFIYKNLISELRRLVQGIQGSNPLSAGGEDVEGGMVSYFNLEQILEQYRDSLGKLETLQAIDTNKLVAFARALKRGTGQKRLFLFLQQEYRPEIEPRVLNALIESNQGNQTILADLHELFQVYHRNLSIDEEAVIRAFCDAGAGVDPIFLTKTPGRAGGIVMREQSEDVFRLFSRVSEATGGLAQTTQNPLAALKEAVRVSGTSYLLTYEAALTAHPAGPFRRISVTIKGRPYRLTYSQGYFGQ